MSRRGKFTPEAIAGVRLEERVVLTGGATLGAPVLLRAFHAPVRASRASVSTLVGLAYDSFQQDFNQVRAVYLNSVQAGTASADDATAFKTYIGQRTTLLAQQVANSFLTYPSGAGKHQSNSVLPLLASKINSNDSNTGSLRTSLVSSAPASNASATTVALSTVSQDDAIEASRVNTLNAVTIVRNGYFGTSKGRH